MNLTRTIAVVVGLAGGVTLVAMPGPVAARTARTASGTTGCRESVLLQPPTESPHSLDAIQFASPSAGWVVGGSRILATTDNGTHWRVQRRSHNADFSAVDAINSSDAWVVGRHTLLRTRNGGRSWRVLHDPCPRINSVHFISPRRGYAIAGNRLLMTSDGGRHWRAMQAPRRAQSVCFFNSKRGWLGAHGQIFRTLDGGATWKRSVRSVHAKNHASVDTFDAVVQCAGPDDGWAELIGGAAASQQAHVGYHLSDAGSRPIFSEGYFPYPGVGPLPASPGGYAGGFSALDSSSAVYVDNCVACNRGTVTMDVATDGGASVRDAGRVSHLNYLTGVSFAAPDEGWGIGYVLHLRAHRETWRVVHTSDGGASWQVQYG